MISFTVTGSTGKTKSFLNSMRRLDIRSVLEAAGREGVAALSAATPMDTGVTAMSWSYEITTENDSTTLSFLNTSKNGYASIAALIQYGHATGTGGFVAGKDYINPALKPIFDKITNNVWKKVTSA